MPSRGEYRSVAAFFEAVRAARIRPGRTAVKMYYWRKEARMKFSHMSDSQYLSGTLESTAPLGHGGFFVRVYNGPISVMERGGSVTRLMLSISTAHGEAYLMYEEVLALKKWLNENVE